ncbi:hypothetical protein [Nonomuraea sp. LPB2021202275-12-8]|uniref:hypothetical protein n=1 Tax=Nonomuraea sp. LPB2021202275-12-8 TaxID=3120159 RepID=UPI00300D8571
MSSVASPVPWLCGPSSDDTVRRYAGLLPGTAFTVCRLHVSPAVLAERVARRGRGDGPALPGDELKGLDPRAVAGIATRATDEAEALDRAGAGDVRIDTDNRSPQEAARLIRDLWPIQDVADAPAV